MSELKSCPRCHSKVKLITAAKDKRRQTNKIVCTKQPCLEFERAAMFGIDGRNGIVTIWNSRHPSPEVEAMATALEGALRVSDLWMPPVTPRNHPEFHEACVLAKMRNNFKQALADFKQSKE